MQGAEQLHAAPALGNRPSGNPFAPSALPMDSPSQSAASRFTFSGLLAYARAYRPSHYLALHQHLLSLPERGLRAHASGAQGKHVCAARH